MRRVGGLVLVAALCALPAAHGDSTALTTTVMHAMTPIGVMLTKGEIEAIFPPNTATAELLRIAHDDQADTGIRLRAIRALPEFCLPSCNGTPPYLSLVSLLPTVTNTQNGRAILLLRATIEAIGVAKSGNPDDVGLLVPFLVNNSRDVRATTAYALRDLCMPSAIVHLRTQYNVEQVMQVRLAISAALRDLDTCTN